MLQGGGWEQLGRDDQLQLPDWYPDWFPPEWLIGPGIWKVGTGDYTELPNALREGVPIPQQNAFYFFLVR